MRCILVGIDGSEGSRAALHWAHQLARRQGSRLRALQAWQYPASAIVQPGAPEMPSTEDADRRTEKQLAGFLAAELGDAAADVDARAGRGPAAAALLRAADDVDLLVVGARGLGGFQALVLGSVSRQVAEHAPCPVVIVPGADPDALPQLRSVLVGYDGSPGATAALAWAGELAGPLDLEVVVAHVQPPDGGLPGEVGPPDEQLRRQLGEEARTAVDDAGARTRLVLSAGDARTVLTQLAEIEGAGLVVVGARGHGPVVNLLLGSVASSLVHHRSRPVAVIPHDRARR